MKKQDIWTCALLGLFSLAVRMLLISKGPFSAESLSLALKAEATLDTLQLQYLFGTGYPLTMIVTAAAIFIGRFLGIDDPVLAANLMSVYASAVSVPLFYLLVQRLYNTPTAVMSAVLLAVSPIYLGISVYAKGHALELIFAFSGLILLLKYIEGCGANALFFSAVLFGCLGAVRVQDLVFILPATFFVMFCYGTGTNQARPPLRETLADALIFGLAMAVVTIAFHLPYLLGPDRSAYLEQFQMFRQLSFTAQHQQSLFLSFPYYRDWFLTNFTVYGLVAAGIGMVLALRANWRTAVFCLLWFAVPFGFYLAIDTTIPRLFVILLPPVIIFAGYFFGYGYRRQGIVAPALGTVICVLLAGMMVLNIYPVLKHRSKFAMIPDYVRWVRGQVPDNARVICKDDFIFYEHYGHFATMTRPNPSGRDDTKNFDAYRFYLEEL
ncbi:MAG: hypothetical protein K8I00_07240, partial [Candidatus Omnitrophica bacterium]|nr:hypothetical protein [Candidatus Omnitrophota bacterium]